MMINERLLEILVCPECKTRLRLVSKDPQTSELLCDNCSVAFPITDGVPQLTPESAVHLNLSNSSTTAQSSTETSEDDS
jgi:uncharacterized protein YbaR (Trm112 family)